MTPVSGALKAADMPEAAPQVTSRRSSPLSLPSSRATALPQTPPSWTDGPSRPSERPAAVTAAPLMIVAGDHAKNDMAGESEDSWKRRLEEAGFEVRPVLKGLGEYPGVREMIARHAAEAERIR